MVTHVLGSLDDKIELNRRMNETLEAMARAVFKSWFVDFDPVRAKVAGRQPFGMNAETAALFPSSFEDSPRGKIPKGWHAGSIYQIADVHYGAPYASGQFNVTRQGKPLIRIRDLAKHDPEVFTTEAHPRAIDIEPGEIIAGMDGEFRVHHWRGPSAVLNQRLCSFRPKHDVPPVYVSEVIREPLSFVERSEAATTVIHLGKVDIDSFVVLVPPHKVLHSFAASAQVLVDRIVHNARESRTLTAIRDTLLPKLISGEVRLKDADKVFGERV
jgi:type I restriction enzyme S subunit